VQVSIRSAARNKHFLTGCEIGAVGSVVRNLTAFAPLPVTDAAGILGLSDICLLKLKMNLAEEGFVSDVDVTEAATSRLNTQNTNFFCAGLEALVILWSKCLKVIGDYLEVWCVPSATYVSCVHRSESEVLGVGVFITYFLEQTCSDQPFEIRILSMYLQFNFVRKNVISYHFKTGYLMQLREINDYVNLGGTV